MRVVRVQFGVYESVCLVLKQLVSSFTDHIESLIVLFALQKEKLNEHIQRTIKR